MELLLQCWVGVIPPLCWDFKLNGDGEAAGSLEVQMVPRSCSEKMK